MRFRVHYRVAGERRTAEVEATSPQEAIVKFRHTRPDRESKPGRVTEILSVSPEPTCEELSW